MALPTLTRLSAPSSFPLFLLCSCLLMLVFTLQLSQLPQAPGRCIPVQAVHPASASGIRYHQSQQDHVAKLSSPMNLGIICRCVLHVFRSADLDCISHISETHLVAQWSVRWREAGNQLSAAPEPQDGEVVTPSGDSDSRGLRRSQAGAGLSM